jgi:hypothetical protein
MQEEQRFRGRFSRKIRPQPRALTPQKMREIRLNQPPQTYAESQRQFESFGDTKDAAVIFPAPFVKHYDPDWPYMTAEDIAIMKEKIRECEEFLKSKNDARENQPVRSVAHRLQSKRRSVFAVSCTTNIRSRFPVQPHARQHFRPRSR